MQQGRSLSVFRVAVFGGILLTLHWQQHRWQGRVQATAGQAADQDRVLQLLREVWPGAAVLRFPEATAGLTEVLDEQQRLLGYAVRTSPQADHILGFSGPTDVLLVLDAQQVLLQARILSSRDTQEHVDAVRQDPRFLPSLIGRDVRQLAGGERLDAVSGATLTSLSILEAVRWRLVLADSGQSPPVVPQSLRFPEPPRLSDVQLLFADAVTVERVPDSGQLWQVRGPAEQPLGQVLRTSPAADNTVGYQGPSDALVGLQPDGQVCGVAVGVSYDNEPYVSYVRDDVYFRGLLNGQTTTALAGLDPVAARIEGVSGATMTSQAVVQGIVQAAQAVVQEQQRQLATAARPAPPGWQERLLTLRNLSTLGLTCLGTVLGLTSLRRRRGLRVLYQLAVIVWLGLINGDLLSQALLLGWAQHGIPWQNALGLSCLSAAALLVPIVSGQNVYCSHVCPHGAVQQLLRNRLPWSWRVSPGLQTWLKRLPLLLLVWVVLLGLLHWPFSAVDIEPFDAWLWQVAGWPAIAIAVTGLVASLFVPMAYCRYGCPTGALLDYLRYARGGVLQARDLAAVLLLSFGLLTLWWT